jgi:hypothetical protein
VLQVYCLHCYEKIHGKKARTKSMPLDTTSIHGDGELGTCPRKLHSYLMAKSMPLDTTSIHRDGELSTCPR